MLEKMGFCEIFRGLVMECVKSTLFSMLVEGLSLICFMHKEELPRRPNVPITFCGCFGISITKVD